VLVHLDGVEIIGLRRGMGRNNNPIGASSFLNRLETEIERL
jgi:hypothetical protein